MMAISQGDAYWASVVASAFPVRRTSGSIDTAQLETRVGKWIKNYGPEVPVKGFRIHDLRLLSPSRSGVRVYIILKRSVRGKGIFFKRIQIPVRFTWTRQKHSGFWLLRLEPSGRILGPTFEDKLQKAYAAYKRKSRNKRRDRRFGFFFRSPVRPSPQTITSYTTNSSTNERIDATNHVYYAPVFSNPGSPYVSYSRTYSSVRTPNFRSLKGRKLPVNPYSLTLVETKDACDFWHYFDTTGPIWTNSPFGSTRTWQNGWQRTSSRWGQVIPAVPSATDSTTYNKAVTKAIEQAESNISGNLAQDFAQFGQTTRLIGNTAIRIAGSLRALRRGNFQKAVQFLVEGKPNRRPVPRRPLDHEKSLASNWLELQYGWKPLLQDIDGAMRSTAAFVARDTSVKEVRGSAVTMANVSDSPIRSAGELTTVCKREVITLYACRVAYRFRVDDHLKAYAAQTGFTNPINLAWEILPYSFVLDWFLPIGPYLETLSAYDGLVFLDGSKTEFMKQYVTVGVNLMNVPVTPVGYKLNESAYYTRDAVVHSRSKLTSFPRLRLPSFKNGVSVTHAANALALMTSAFKH